MEQGIICNRDGIGKELSFPTRSVKGPRTMSFNKVLFFAALGLNIYAFVVMGLDKARARAGESRTPEKKLFLIAACGGSLGILAAMYVFRHKTKHIQFVLGIPCIIAAQAYCAYLLLW